MTESEKFQMLHSYLSKQGHFNRLTSLVVQLRLCESDRWLEHDVTRLYAEGDRIYYSTPSFSDCSLWPCDNSDVRNAAYLFDQLLGKLSNRDRNLF